MPIPTLRTPPPLAGVRERLGQNDPMALAELYDATGAALLALARNVGGAASAEAVIEAVYQSAWRERHALPEDGDRLLRWMFTRCHRLAAAHRGDAR